MRSCRRIAFACGLAVLVLGAQLTAGASAAPTAPDGGRPAARTLYADGPSGRFLVDGTWLRRLDPSDVGQRAGWQRQAAAVGWDEVSVPDAWNARDESVASYLGSVAWYRRDLRLPAGSARRSWVLRFESVNYRATIWLNGRRLATHAGAYLPFELRLPRRILRRTGVNRIVLRVDSRRTSSDFPPAKTDARGRPLGGWWNYGGILREVYLRAIDDVDIAALSVSTELPCARCSATVRWDAELRNLGARPRTVTVSARWGARRLTLGRATLGPGVTAHVGRALRVANPHLWSPSDPHLYDASVRVAAGSRTLQRFTRKVGVRSVKVTGGRLLLNGQPLNLRGVGLQEDSRAHGFAIDNAVRDRQLGWARELGSSIIRAHYPLQPHTLELADREGVLVWSEVPVYQVETEELAKSAVRDAAVEVLRTSILTNRDHPSVLLWAIGNELSSRPGPAQAAYISAAVAVARQLDPGRPVGIAVGAIPGVGCQSDYAPLDVIGLNDYFGWYPGPAGASADRDLLSGYLDEMRACYPKQALMISEFGAEANRDGPVEERGTYAFQSDFAAYHLDVYATKGWLSGAIWWALQEFRVRPAWDGGNPWPSPPLHQKGVVTFDGAPKPAFATLQRLFRATRQFDAR